MKKRTKILFTVIMEVLLFSIMTCKVYAKDDADIQEVTESFSVNEEAKNEEDLFSFSNEYSATSANIDSANIPKINTLDNGALYVRKEMVKRSQVIAFKVDFKYYKGIIKDVFNRAVEEDGYTSSSEGDYLLKNFSKYKCGVQIKTVGSNQEITFKYTMDYLTTKEEEDEVNEAVNKFWKGYNVKTMSEYSKAKAVHDFEAKNIKYDYNYNNYSAYNAIIDRSVVCQGFASLTYKMLKEAGINTRIITGTSDKGEAHAWNIACINNKWYNLDNTWDENLSSNNNICYIYFLKNNADFKKHNRESQYTTSAFQAKYPISATSYGVSSNSKAS